MRKCRDDRTVSTIEDANARKDVEPSLSLNHLAVNRNRLCLLRNAAIGWTLP
jgi:hypothetical protein